MAREIVHSETYLKKLKRRIEAGKAQKIELLLWHYASGVPKQPFQIEGADGSDPFATVLETLWRTPRSSSGSRNSPTTMYSSHSSRLAATSLRGRTSSNVVSRARRRCDLAG